MVVEGRNKYWNLDMPFLLFQNTKEHSPNTLVEVEELTQSTYKEKKKIPIRELEDHSIARNRNACNSK